MNKTRVTRKVRWIAAILGYQALALAVMMLAAAAMYEFSTEPDRVVKTETAPAESPAAGAVSTISLDLSLDSIGR
ncbi:MAG: hypothetical protein QNJ40_01825 [Xanthomonadales bacterium]|nr:hypothetical protein [Xanthomonadales bacterium]